MSLLPRRLAPAAVATFVVAATLVAAAAALLAACDGGRSAVRAPAAGVDGAGIGVQVRMSTHTVAPEPLAAIVHAGDAAATATPLDAGREMTGSAGDGGGSPAAIESEADHEANHEANDEANHEANHEANDEANHEANDDQPLVGEARERDPRSDTVKIKVIVDARRQAHVIWGRKDLGIAPLEIERPRNSGPLDLVVVTPGYLPLHARAFTDRADVLSLRLYAPAEAAQLLGYRSDWTPTRADLSAANYLPALSIPNPLQNKTENRSAEKRARETQEERRQKQ